MWVALMWVALMWVALMWVALMWVALMWVALMWVALMWVAESPWPLRYSPFVGVSATGAACAGASPGLRRACPPGANRPSPSGPAPFLNLPVGPIGTLRRSM